MKRILLAGAALLALTVSQPVVAADAPVAYKAPPIAAYSWSGFYIGGHLGGVWSHTDWSGISFDPSAVYSFYSSGIAGGVHGGFNYQVQQWVFGIEGSWTSIDLSDGFASSPSNSYATKIDWITTVVGRVGYTWDRWLLYVSGGYAGAQVIAIGTGGGLPGPFRLAATDNGWTVGGGLEFMWWNNFVFGADYKYIELGGSRSGVTPLPFGIPVAVSHVDTRIQVATARLSYKFSWPR